MPGRGGNKSSRETTPAELGLSTDCDLGAELVMALQSDTCHVAIRLVTDDEDPAVEWPQPPRQASVVGLHPLPEIVEIDEVVQVSEDPEPERLPFLAEDCTDSGRQRFPATTSEALYFGKRRRRHRDDRSRRRLDSEKGTYHAVPLGLVAKFAADDLQLIAWRPRAQSVAEVASESPIEIAWAWNRVR